MYQTPVEGFRLSPQQDHLWKPQQTSTAYHVQFALSLEGDLNVKTLIDSVRDIVERHEILRTVFQYLPGIKQPVQVINESAAAAFFWHELDLRHLAAPDHQPVLRQLLEQEAEHNFDFAHGPLLRLCVVCLTESRHVLVVTQPAMCADGWSSQKLVTDLARSYDARLKGNTLTDTEAQYADLSEWQHEIQVGEDAIEGSTDWRENLSAVTPSRVLSFEKQCAINELEVGFAPARVEVTTGILPGTATEAFYLACWHALLARLTQQAEVVVAVECDGGRWAELEGALGLFARSVPVRSKLRSKTVFSDLLRATEEGLRQARELQSYWSWDAKDHKSSLPESGYFRYAFAFEQRVRRTEMGHVKVDVLSQYNCVERFGLKLVCVQAEDGSTVFELHYDQAIFERSDVERLGQQYATLLRCAISDGARQVAEL